MISVATYASADECVRAAAMIHDRLRRTAPVREGKTAEVVMLRIDRQQDDHVLRWHQWRIARATPLKTYIRQRCEEMDVCYMAITARTRAKNIVAPRHLVMWEIKRLVKPSISWMSLAILFGLTDHTSAIYAVRKIDRLKERGEI